VRLIGLLPIVIMSLGLVAAGCDRQKEEAPQASVEQGGQGIDRSHRGAAAPVSGFRDGDGGDTSLAAFKGKPTLVNLWASWCAPCVKELPTLDRLAAQREGELNVVAISQDMAPQSSVTAFLQSHRIATLEAHHDPEMSLTDALGVQIMPTSVLYDAAGREVWRFTGDLDWTGEEARKLLAEALSPATAH